MRLLKYILIIFLFIGKNAAAQQLHFSQYFNTPLLVNPASTGFNPDYDYRMGASYRNQWANVISNPYQTTNLWGDAQLFMNKIESGWAGIGGNIYKDQAGTGNLSTTQGYASFAYHQMLGLSSLLSMGINAGIVNQQVDASKLIFDDQWNTSSGQFSNPTTQTLDKTNISYFDLHVGVNYALFLTDNAYFNLGLSMQHINTPSASFYAANSGLNQKIPIRYNFFLNANYKIEDLWILNPNIYISQSDGNKEFVIGMNAMRNLNDDGTKQLIAGIYYRNKDAIIPMVGYQINDLMFTVNYDVTTSGLGGFNGLQGAYEASIVKRAIYMKGHRGIKCPVMKF